MYEAQPTFDLLQETVGRPLCKAIRDLGCPDLPVLPLRQEQGQFLQEQIDGLPSDLHELSAQLAERAMDGKLISVGVAADGSSLFTVRMKLRKADCVVTLSYYQEAWTLHRLDSVQTRWSMWNKAALGGLLGAAVTAALALLYGGLSNGDVVAEAKEQGYVVMTQEQYDVVLNSRSGDGVSAIGGEAPKEGEGSGGTEAASNLSSEAVTFTLQEGMPIADLTSFLQQNGLIEDQAAFNQELTNKGIDRLIQPKAYTFRKDMTEQDVLTILQG